MPKWHKTLLTLATLMLGVGAAGQMSTAMSGEPPAANGTLKTLSDEDLPAWQRYSPAMARTGGGFIVAFVVGWISRIFVKTMALLASAGAAVFLALSYFNVFNLDLSKAEKKYESGVAWVTDQGERVSKSLMTHVPASASTVLGAFCGFKRKK
jgi:uncharacterized membrane protein (Fun14 family)